MGHIYHILPGFFSQVIEAESVLSLSPGIGLDEPSGHSESPGATEFAVHPPATHIAEQVPPRFGLKHATSNRWPLLLSHIDALNSLGDANENIKLLFLVRHGEGYHNVAEAKYGTQAWDDFWSKLEGDGVLTWGPDSLLTPTGVSQAYFTRRVWETEVDTGGLTPPRKIYCSPLSRALQTCEIVFDGYSDTVTVIENSREENGVHTCDKRQPRSSISQSFPNYHIEHSLTEEDQLWDPAVRETKAQVSTRAQSVIDRLWDDYPNDNFVAITAHSGFINGVLCALGAKPYPLPTGGVLPLVIRRMTNAAPGTIGKSATPILDSSFPSR